MPKLSRLRDWTLLLGCNLIWASQFVMVKLVQAQMGPVFATFLPISLATATNSQLAVPLSPSLSVTSIVIVKARALSSAALGGTTNE